MKLAQAATGGGGKKSKAAAAQPAQRPMFVEVMKYRSTWGCSKKAAKAKENIIHRCMACDLRIYTRKIEAEAPHNIVAT